MKTSKNIIVMDCGEKFALGAIHKRRLLRGGGRGAPQKPMKGDENRYLVLGKAYIVYELPKPVKS